MGSLIKMLGVKIFLILSLSVLGYTKPQPELKIILHFHQNDFEAGPAGALLGKPESGLDYTNKEYYDQYDEDNYGDDNYGAYNYGDHGDDEAHGRTLNKLLSRNDYSAGSGGFKGNKGGQGGGTSETMRRPN